MKVQDEFENFEAACEGHETARDFFEAGWKAARGQQEPVAWERKWSADGEKPAKKKNENGRLAWPKKFKFLAVTKHKIFEDDVPLYTHPAQPVQPAGAQEPVGEIQIEDMGQPFNAMRVRVHFYKEVPPVGEKLYTAPPAAAINEQMLEALKELTSTFEMFVQGITVPEESVLGRNFVSAHAAIAEAEKAKGGAA